MLMYPRGSPRFEFLTRKSDKRSGYHGLTLFTKPFPENLDKEKKKKNSLWPKEWAVRPWRPAAEPPIEGRVAGLTGGVFRSDRSKPL